MSIILPILLGIGVSIAVAVFVEIAMRLLERSAPIHDAEPTSDAPNPTKPAM